MGNTVAQIAFRLNGKHLGRFAVAAVFLLSFFVSGAWGACGIVQRTTPWYNSQCQSTYEYYVGSSTAYSCTGTYQLNVGSCNKKLSYTIYSSSPIICLGAYNSTFDVYAQYQTCGSQCEADSVSCINQGYTWVDDPSAECGKSCSSCDEQCQCEEQPGMIWNGTECVEDSSLCAEDRANCVRAGGIFSGSTNSGCCISTCDLCNNATMLRWKNLKAAECCNQGMAPPDSIRDCRTPPNDHCGMAISKLTTLTTTDYECQDPNLDAQVKQRFFDQCFEPQSSSSGEPGSSGSGGSSSSMGSSDSQGNSSVNDSPYPEGCDECPYLDSILDTLIKQKKNTDDIVTCLTTPNLCAGLSIQIPDSIKTPVFAFDTAFRKYLQPLMDSSLKLDSNQLKALMKLDTNILKQLRTDSVKLQNDTNTWRVVEGAGDQVDTSIHSMNDTTRKWFKLIADSIGVTTDSLAAHIDSIIRHIPDSVLDSIVKYQQYASDNFDSVLFGTGKGFSLVDSLIDSSVKYFKESNQKWNEYISMYGDSTQKIHEEIIDLPGRNASAIGQALGYGDTATSTLRGDLNGIREAIEDLGDTNGLGGYGDGYGDSLGRYRDSINKYYISDERFGELVDSTEAAWGVDSLDARWDSSYAYGLCEGDNCPPCSDDSCMGSLSGNFVQRADSIARIAGDSLEASTKRQRDSLPTFWDSTFKELKQYSWFGSFDSTFLANIGAKIPNSNTCPEHCFAMDVNGTYAYVGYNMHLDWKLCRPIAPNVLNSLNAFDILKLLARILTVVTCLSILMWEVSSRRGGGIGL